MMRDLQQSSLFFGANAPYVEELYEQYLLDPASVPEGWRKQFDALPNVAGNAAKDVAHTPVIAAFAERAKTGGGRVVYVSSPAQSGSAGGNSVSGPALGATTDEYKKSLKVLQFIRLRGGTPTVPAYLSGVPPPTPTPLSE